MKSKLEKKLETMSRPYKKSKGYEIFGRQKGMCKSTREEGGNPYVFWNPNVNYIPKYEVISRNTKQGTRTNNDKSIEV